MKSTTATISLLLVAGGGAQAATNLFSVGVNFLDDVVVTPLAAATVAGAVPQANWNNGAGANNTLSNLTADLNGGANATAISVTWSGSPNTWASTGRGEENNGFAAGGDRDLMTGYIDTDNTSVTTMVFSGIPAPFSTGGFDVYVYMLGGVPGRGGQYTLGATTLQGDSPTNPSAHSQDLGVDHNDVGTYLLFPNVTGTSFTLTGTPIFGGTPRAPINGIQLVQRIPEPAAPGLAGLVAAAALLRRRRR